MQDMRAALRQRGIDARLMASTADPADEATAADYTFRGSTGALRALRETFNPDAVFEEEALVLQRGEGEQPDVPDTV